MLSMDLRKTFDMVDHEKLFQSLGFHGLHPQYIHLLQLLYQNQKGRVGESRVFDIMCGVKQGDVLSAALFNCVIDIVFEDWKLKLREEGIMVSMSNERLANTRFADGIMLYGKSLDEL